jgi:aminodeoxychorismate synthase component I
VHEIDMAADELVEALLGLAESEPVCILDSCGIGNLGSHLLIAGIEPAPVKEVTNSTPESTLSWFNEALAANDKASIFTISYDFGRKLLGISDGTSDRTPDDEPDIFLAQFDVLIIHDYVSGATWLCGDQNEFERIVQKLATRDGELLADSKIKLTKVRSNFSREEYLGYIETIKEQIRSGNTYQTNLTQQLSAQLPSETTPEEVFYRLRRDHPAPFSAFLKRPSSTVVSASPERFIRIDLGKREISTSPVKGTRPRGSTPGEDTELKRELLNSVKDRAENVMIVDLLRNDIGRVCEYGSVEVEQLCSLETHPTFFHLVSTVSGQLRAGVSMSEVLKAVFPCGSITGAPKISTMRIIESLEKAPRGLSMGAIGYYVPADVFDLPETLDTSVAIRTVVMRGGTATFNVGGGIVIDSDPENEYEESLIKAKALISALNGHFE